MSSKYSISYHLVFCTKYRLPFLSGKEDFLKSHLLSICNRYNWTLLDSAFDSDHIHLVISSNPTIAPGYIVRIIKQLLAYSLITKFPDLRKNYLWGTKKVFSSGSFISSIGQVSKESLSEYLKHHSMSYE